MQLDKIDVSALRKANDICFHHRGGEHYIRCLFRPSEDTPYETERRIDVEGRIRAYDQDVPTDRRDAFHMLHGSRMNPVWTTIASLLRGGDELVLVWVAGNDSEVVREAGLHQDELMLLVHRGGKPKWTFLIDARTCPDNTARLVRSSGVRAF